MYKVLLVEDESDMRERIARTVAWEEHGFVLIAACGNGDQALAIQKNTPVDVIITDINMPMMDGLTLAGHISESWPSTQVVILSGYDDFNYAQTAIRHKVYEYILKPITASQLYQVLGNLKRDLDARPPKSVAADSFLVELIGSTLEREVVAGQLEKLELSLTMDPACVAVAGIQLDITTPSAQSEFRKIIEQAIKGKGESTRDSNGRMVLFFSGSDPEKTAEKLLSEFSKQFMLPVSVVIGPQVEHLGELAQSYSVAEEAWEHIYRLSPNQVVYSKQLLPTTEHRPKLGHVRREILQAIRLIDKGEAEEALNRFIKEISLSSWTKSEARNQLQKLLLFLTEYAEDEDIPISPGTQESLNGQPNLFFAHIFLKQFIEKIIEEREHQGDSTSREGLIVVEYIKKNYAKAGFSMQNVTDYLSVSTSHFCVMFKEYTGTTFIDFLTRIRINKAQELMLATDLKSYEIAELVGYDDPGYFRSVFKKATGLSPTQYRKKYTA